MSTRDGQRARTRKAIVRAAAALLERGERPELDEVAAAAGVSRATAYRYFPGLDALLAEAAVDMLVPEPSAVLGSDAPRDPAARLRLVDTMFDHAVRQREVPLRLMLARTLERATLPREADTPLRQNRRVPMLERALEPVAGQLTPQAHARLVQALAMIVGTEGFIALTDVVGLDAAEAAETRRWAIEALLAAALGELRT